MSVHNCKSFVAEAIISVLNQTYRDFTFEIMDDASTDGTTEIIKGFTDHRINFYRNTQRLGLTRSLNFLLKRAKGEYIARIDADDIAEPERFQLQVGYLRDHPFISIVGSWCRYVDGNGEVIGVNEPPTDPNVLRWELLKQNVLIHSTIMMKAAAIKRIGGYDNSYQYAQDYDLWCRILVAGGQIANIGKYLVKYRRVSTQISNQHFKEQEKAAFCAQLKCFKALLGQTVSDRDCEILRNLLRGNAVTGNIARLPKCARKLIKFCASGADNQTKSFLTHNLATALARSAHRSVYINPCGSLRLAFEAFRTNPSVAKNGELGRLFPRLLYSLVCRSVATGRRIVFE